MTANTKPAPQGKRNRALFAELAAMRSENARMRAALLHISGRQAGNEETSGIRLATIARAALAKGAA